MFFISKEDVAIYLVLALLVYGEAYTNIWLISFYKENSVLFENICKHIKGMPAIWMIQCLWNIVDFLLGSSLYVFYRHSDDIMTSDYVFDNITLLIIINVILVKLHPIIFMHLKYTLCSLIMLILVVSTTMAMLIIFAVNDKWDAFSYMIPYLLWNIYLAYINFNWIRVEQMKRVNLIQ